MTKKPATYADGVGADRCTHCGAILRHGGEPMVAIRRRDVEVLALMLAGFQLPELPVDLLMRLEQAVGRPVTQIEAEK